MKNGISLNQFFAIKTIVASLFYVTICLSVQSSFAQQSGWDPAEYLKDRDQNSNGQLDQDEMRGRLKRYLAGLGFSTEQPVPIADVINRVRNGNESAESKRKSSNRIERKVPGFGEPTENDGVPGFSDSQPDTSSSIEQEFGDEIMRRVQRTLERYDKNGNNRLDPDEIGQVRWGRPSPQESDLDNNGSLSLRELAMRVTERNRSNRSDWSNSGDRNNSGDSKRDYRSEGNERARESEQQSSEGERRESENWRGGGRWGSRGGSRDGSDRSRESFGKTSDSEARAEAKERAREAARIREQESKQEQSEADDTESESSSSAKTNRYVKFTDGIMRQLDKDGDGALNEEEMKKFRRPPANADANGDGSVTREELLQAYSPNESESSESSRTENSDSNEEREKESKRGRSSPFRSPSNRSSGSSKRKSSGVFGNKDANGDGLLQMHEFTDDWTMEKIDEFKAIDLNNNGILTSDEYRNRER